MPPGDNDRAAKVGDLVGISREAVPDLTGPLGAGIGGQVLVGSLLSLVGAYGFLTRYFAKARSLTPFGIYCLAGGLASVGYLLVR